MSRRYVTREHPPNDVRCPDPTCGAKQGMSELAEQNNGEFRGRCKARCQCGQAYIVHVADGWAYVTGLYPDDWDVIQIDWPMRKIKEVLRNRERDAA